MVVGAKRSLWYHGIERTVVKTSSRHEFRSICVETLERTIKIARHCETANVEPWLRGPVAGWRPHMGKRELLERYLVTAKRGRGHRGGWDPTVHSILMEGRRVLFNVIPVTIGRTNEWIGSQLRSCSERWVERCLWGRGSSGKVGCIL